MIDCVLHVGVGKTGSSALQAYLSRHPVLNTPRGHRYVVIDDRGQVLGGDGIGKRAAAAAEPAPYVASTPRLWERDDLDAVGRRLAAAAPPPSVPILSQEGWDRRGRECLEADGLHRLGLRAQVVAYVRPQIEWLNSAWWQWWTWVDGLDAPADLLRRWRNGWRPGFLRWRTQLEPWAANANVDELTVRLYRRNTVPDFLALVGAPPPAPNEDLPTNRSLALRQLRILKFVPGLRRQHTPQYDWVLQRLLPSTEPTPWALTPDDMRAVVDGCRADNEKLLALLAREDADEMRRDPRWWSIEPYLDRRPVTPDDLAATPDDLRATIEALLNALKSPGSAGLHGPFGP